MKNSKLIRIAAWPLLLSFIGGLTGCSIFSPRPENHIVPAVSFQARERQLNNKPKRPRVVDRDVQWMRQFTNEVEAMNGWAPPAAWFTNQSSLTDELVKVMKDEQLPAYRFNDLLTGFETNDLRVAGNYFFLSTGDQDLSGLADFLADKSYFHEPFPTADLPLTGRNNVRRLAADLLLEIDEQHKTLFTDKSPGFHDRGWRWFSQSPQMVSPVYPVGVTLAVMPTTDTTASSPASTNAPPLVTVNNYSLSGTNLSLSLAPTKVQSDKSTNSDNSLLDFNPIENVTFSISTVLNSADTGDRIDYVSTFIYIYPYQRPPNADVIMDDEFWKHFFIYQAIRPDGPRTEFVRDDLFRSFDALRTHFQSVTTTVVDQNLTLGTLQRGTEDDLSSTLAAAIPVAPATINPSVTAAAKATSSMNETILKQLDQRSSYVSADTSFLRITQRGMSSVNLNGRINEKVQLYVPPATDPVYVVQTNETSSGLDIAVKAAGEPVYSRVDALVVSVVVVRHPTKLRRSNQETFGLPLEDAANNDFVVGIPRPSRVTLWQWDRTLDDVYTSEVDSKIPASDTRNKEVYFDNEGIGISVAHPLYMDGFDNAKTLALKGTIALGFQNSSLKKAASGIGSFTNLVVSAVRPPGTNATFYIVLSNHGTGTATRLGLSDGNSPSALQPFPEDYFK